MRHRIIKPLLFTVLALLLAVSGFAQRQTGTISGQVVDEEKNPLPGASVTLTGTAMMGSKDFVTTETGLFRFVALSPGSDYEVRVSMPGFTTMIRPGLIVSVGKTTDVEIVMEPSTVQEEITVTAASPTVDVQATKMNVNYSAQFPASIPMNRDLYDIQNSIPGAISEGIDYRRTSSILGGTVRSQLYALDGVPMNDPATFYSMANINVDVYEEIEFETGGHPAEVGQTDSTYVNIVTKSGGNRISGAATFYYTTKDFAEDLISLEDQQALNVNPPEKYTDYKDLSVNIGGPIVKDKVWFFLDGRRQTWDQAYPGTPENRMQAIGFTPDPETGIAIHYDLSHQEWMGFGKLTWQITKSLKYMGMLHYNHMYEPVYQNSVGTNDDYSSTWIWDHENTYTTTHQFNWVLNQNSFLDIRGTYIDRYFPLHSRNEGEYTYYDSAEQVYWGTHDYNDVYRRKKYLASAAMTYFADNLFNASHEFKGGIEFEQSEYHRDWYRANPYYSYWYDYAAGNPYYYSRTRNEGRLRIRMCPAEEGQWDVQDHVRRFSGYVQDSMTTGRLTLNLGLRLDFSYQYEPPQTRPGTLSNYIPPQADPTDPAFIANPNALIEAINQQFNDEDLVSPYEALSTPYKRPVEFFTLSPRIGVVYDLRGDGRTALKASFGRYYEPVWSSKYNAAQIFGANSVSFRWTDENENGFMDLPPVDTYEPTSYPNQDPNYSFYVDNLKAPYMHEFMLGIEHELVKDFKIGLQGIYKVNKNIVEDSDINNGYDPTATDGVGLIWLPYTVTDYGMDGVLGTSDDKQLTVYGLREDRPVPSWYGFNPPEAKRTYWAAILTFEKRMTNKWQLKGSVLYSRFKGNADPGYSATEGQSGAFDDPNDMTYAYGSVAFDRPFQLKIMGSYILPYDFIVSAYFQARSGTGWGRTYDRVYFPDDAPTQASYTYVRAEPDGTRWNPSYANLDLRIEKEFKFGKNYRFNLYADIFNVAGRSGYNINQNPYARLYFFDDPPEYRLSTTYSDITSIYGVRSFRLGARFSF